MNAQQHHDGSLEESRLPLPFPPVVTIPRSFSRDDRIQATAAIVADSARWNHTGRMLAWAKGVLTTLELSEDEFSNFGVNSEARSRYNEVCAEFDRILAEGASAMEGVSARLAAVAGAIQLNEDESRQMMTRVREMLEE